MEDSLWLQTSKTCTTAQQVILSALAAHRELVRRRCSGRWWRGSAMRSEAWYADWQLHSLVGLTSFHHPFLSLIFDIFVSLYQPFDRSSNSRLGGIGSPCGSRSHGTALAMGIHQRQQPAHRYCRCVVFELCHVFNWYLTTTAAAAAASYCPGVVSAALQHGGDHGETAALCCCELHVDRYGLRATRQIILRPQIYVAL